jgi:hypothetical protein
MLLGVVGRCWEKCPDICHSSHQRTYIGNLYVLSDGMREGLKGFEADPLSLDLTCLTWWLRIAFEDIAKAL